jgi:two-component system cell cycle sensor histidine kinase/response regulator CckA
MTLLKQAGDEVRLVLLDLSMPQVNGEQTYRKLHALVPDLPVILTSGYNETEMSRRFTGQGLAGFLQKPYELEDLARKVKDALR